ncbi:hypothetical protein LOZ12_002698 [Ophidiomyces ophidiicola]|uniref:Uncharacterized protein n=1 Tax=Ophidiomyces ophidiicola TaxID=1387563 RepID=A0ACB8UX97_9EURO|nr:uncharacterized protein LOZ57_004057 [Ophidiomyces ophidiicola]KAI1945806.1 hypothetical protein LOZ57_004057 [Ophidiomyces ophidiicola]KAI1946370.1 hypothetical protein LOZ62_003378 [Ophidiomyces ophidiicola]KAI1966356.1 hypothetical protein LOZ56_005808 [Ophidiomyces ophidiicola]KAI1980182.1 hypothetical protein LOZ55_001584 [Ophidiomyces ophidiicola]KAI1988555.1 hypothetical protein LOZ54_003159 [Ophidiomyces ophidiicola]
MGAKMAAPLPYLSLPILDELVKSVETKPADENAVKLMASGILNHYFSVANGYIATPERTPDGNSPDSITLRIRRYLPRTQSFMDHAVADIVPMGDPLPLLFAQLESTPENCNADASICWKMKFYACTIEFYEDHHCLEHPGLVPYPAPKHNIYHLRTDSEVIDMMLRQMTERNVRGQIIKTTNISEN